MAEQKLLFRRGTKDNLEAILKGEILRPQRGEPIAEINSSSSNEDYIKFKIGDGEHDYADLPYVAGGSEGPTEYLKSASVSGNKLTLIKQDDSTIVFEPEGVVYTAGDGIKIEGTLISVDTNFVAKKADLEAEVTRATAAEGDLDERLKQVEGRGRFLSNWDAATGKPTTYPTPTSYPFTYTFKSGDYYLVSNVPASGVKYAPSGSSISKASESAEWVVGSIATTEDLTVGGQYTFDSANWTYTGSAVAKVTVTQKECAAGADHAAILATIANPKQGDIAIIKEAIEDTAAHRQYTAYIYNGTAWVAMDGNYNANNVILAEDITLAGNYDKVGNIERSATTFATKGKSVADAFKEIFTKRLQPTIVNPPATSLSGLQNSEDLEIGTNVSKSGTMTGSLSAGSYTYGPATGVVAQSWASEIKYTAGKSGQIASSTAANTPYSYSFQLGTDTVSINFKATATHNAGTIAKDNLGDDSDPVIQIAAGSKSKDSTASYTSYRKMFYGTRADKTELDSAKIRALSGKKTATGAISVSIPVGSFRTVIAVPAARTVTSVKDVNGMGAEILSSFTQTTLDVEGANGFTAISYKIYYIDYAEAISKANTYTVTIA